MPTRTEAVMGTLVTIRVLTAGAEVDEAVERAFDWFHEIEDRCTRFDRHSELMQLCGKPGKAVAASSILYEAVGFALAVAEETGGAFDPTVGYRMESLGFNNSQKALDLKAKVKECRLWPCAIIYVFVFIEAMTFACK